MVCSKPTQRKPKGGGRPEAARHSVWRRPKAGAFVLALNKAHVLALKTAHILHLNKADVLALSNAHILRFNNQIYSALRRSDAKYLTRLGKVPPAFFNTLVSTSGLRVPK